MPVDTHGLQQQHVGKRLRVTFADGQTQEIKVVDVTVCDEPEPCCGIIYDLIATDSTRKVSTHWAAFDEIKTFQVLGD
jgi:hypothetical protein